MLFDAVPAGVQLVTLPGARGILEFKEGDMRLVLAGNLDFTSSPAMESVVTLHPASAGQDLEFTLDRGRVLVENHKESGALKVRVRIHGKDLDFALLNSKTSVALELFSRWSAGAPFLKQPKADHKPVGDFIFLVPAGSATLELNQQPQALEGPVMVHFNTLQGMQGPLALKAAPTWVKPAADPPVKVKTLEAAGEKLRRAPRGTGRPASANQGAGQHR